MKVRLSLTMVAVAFLVAAPCWGQVTEGLDTNGMVIVGDETDWQDPALVDSPDWGPGFIIVNMGAAGFNSKEGDMVWNYYGTGYINHVSGSSSQYWMPVDLPVGCSLHGMRVFYYDNSASDISAYLTRYYGSSTPGVQDIVGWNSSGTPGYTSTYVTIGETIHYDHPTDGEQSYNVILWPHAAGTTLRFKGVRLLYYLQISPAPATATFADVPVGAFGFKHVEALVASGITAGCGGGNFCPNTPVTRVQMAVFLAKALGLHWGF
jgi:hypothetical protein